METRWLTAAEYLGYRLKELGVTHLFVVPGDYNLPLLDGLATVPGLTLVNTANELNAAYAADGHARSQGLGCVVTTFLVGALSAINGTAASFAEEIPVLSVVGVPGTSQYATSSAPHHSLGNLEDIGQEVDCYKPVTVYQTILRSLKDARYLIDKALLKTLTHRKPVLLEVCRDVALLPHPSFGRRGEPLEALARPVRACNEESLVAAAQAAAEWLNTKQRPLIVVGRRARHYKQELLQFAEATGYAVTAVADGKSFFPEDHPQFIGTYFKSFSDPASISDAVAASDALVFVGVHFHEFNWPSVPDNATHERGLILYKSRAVLALTRAFTMVPTSRMLPALAALAKPNPGALEYFRSRPAVPPELPPSGPDFTAPDDAPLKTKQVYDEIQALVGQPGYDLVVDTGDSLWRSNTLRLAKGNSFENQVLAGNIGPGLPCGLGFSLGAATKTRNRMIIIIGDGGLQMTAQEIGTFSRFGSNAIVVVINNDGYLVERYLSPYAHASYNYVNRWDYSAVAAAMCNNHGQYKVIRSTTLEEAQAAFKEAAALRDHFVFLEMVVSPKDAAPAAGAVRRQFAGAFFAPFPLYKRQLEAELGPEFVKSSAGIAAKRAMSESISEALAAAALSPRTSLDGPPGGGRLAGAGAAGSFTAAANGAAAAQAMPTINSIGSLASLGGSASEGAEAGSLGKSPLGSSMLGTSP